MRTNILKKTKYGTYFPMKSKWGLLSVLQRCYVYHAVCLYEKQTSPMEC